MPLINDWPRDLARREAEQSGDLLPCGWCGLHHDEGRCAVLVTRWPDAHCASGKCLDPHECRTLGRCADLHTLEYLESVERNERTWAIRFNHGSGDES